MTDVGWAILGTGGIAAAMATTLAGVPEATLVAVGSRREESARAFADRFGAPVASTYEEAVASEDVDVVYVATTNDLHAPLTLAAIDAGKAVLCEKPFALDVVQARTMVEAAAVADVFLMEAMWMRYIPAFRRAEELVLDGVIGDVRFLSADFSFPASPPPGRLYDRSLGGGGLVDVGIYPLTTAYAFLGAPSSFHAEAVLTEGGVDTQVVVVGVHEDARMSALTASIATDGSQTAVLMGTEGHLVFEPPAHHSQRLFLRRGLETVETIELPHAGTGYEFEVAEVHDALVAGRRQSSVHDLDDTLAVLDTLDRIRAAIGVEFPKGVPGSE